MNLNKNMMEMEENVEKLSRNLDILDMKISLSHENLEKNILQKV
jgi:hypothetical protein